METFEAVVTIALGVALGISFLSLINAVASIPSTIKRNRERRELKEFFEMMSEAVVRNEEAAERNKNVKKAQQAAKRSAARQRSEVANKPVRSGRKGTSKKTSDKS